MAFQKVELKKQDKVGWVEAYRTRKIQKEIQLKDLGGLPSFFQKRKCFGCLEVGHYDSILHASRSLSNR